MIHTQKNNNSINFRTDIENLSDTYFLLPESYRINFVVVFHRRDIIRRNLTYMFSHS